MRLQELGIELLGQGPWWPYLVFWSVQWELQRYEMSTRADNCGPVRCPGIALVFLQRTKEAAAEQRHGGSADAGVWCKP